MGFLHIKKSEEEKEIRNGNGGVLAVWGSPGSGKTTVSVKLAENLTKKGKNVLLVFTDMVTPPLPYIAAPSDLIGDKSLGSILAATHVNTDLVKRNCVFYKKNKHLSMVGMQKGENIFTYPPFDERLATEFLYAAEETAPYVIVDCTSDVTSDELTKAALINADYVIRLVNCNLKSISFLSSQLPLLSDAKWDVDRQIKIASNVKANEAAGSIESILGSVAFRVPFSQEIENQFLEGDMLRETSLKSGKGFQTEIDRIVQGVFL